MRKTVVKRLRRVLAERVRNGEKFQEYTAMEDVSVIVKGKTRNIEKPHAVNEYRRELGKLKRKHYEKSWSERWKPFQNQGSSPNTEFFCMRMQASSLR